MMPIWSHLVAAAVLNVDEIAAATKLSVAISNLPVLSGRVEIPQAQAAIDGRPDDTTGPLLEASVATTTYRLSVLTGRQPNALTEKLAAQSAPGLPPGRAACR